LDKPEYKESSTKIIGVKKKPVFTRKSAAYGHHKTYKNTMAKVTGDREQAAGKFKGHKSKSTLPSGGQDCQVIRGQYSPQWTQNTTE